MSLQDTKPTEPFEFEDLGVRAELDPETGIATFYDISADQPYLKCGPLVDLGDEEATLSTLRTMASVFDEAVSMGLHIGDELSTRKMKSALGEISSPLASVLSPAENIALQRNRLQSRNRARDYEATQMRFAGWKFFVRKDITQQNQVIHVKIIHEEGNDLLMSLDALKDHADGWVVTVNGKRAEEQDLEIAIDKHLPDQIADKLMAFLIK